MENHLYGHNAEEDMGVPDFDAWLRDDASGQFEEEQMEAPDLDAWLQDDAYGHHDDDEVDAPDFDALLHNDNIEDYYDAFSVEALGVDSDADPIPFARDLLHDEHVCASSSVEKTTAIIMELMDRGLSPDTVAGLLWERGLPAEHQRREVTYVVRNQGDEHGLFAGCEGEYQQIGPSEVRSVLMFIVWGNGQEHRAGVVWHS